MLFAPPHDVTDIYRHDLSNGLQSTRSPSKAERTLAAETIFYDIDRLLLTDVLLCAARLSTDDDYLPVPSLPRHPWQLGRV